MGWLNTKQVLRIAGHYVSDTPTQEQLDAVQFAEELIEQRTSLVWGASQPDTIRVTLRASSYLLPLPLDVTAVNTVTPAIARYALWEHGRLGLELFDATYDQLAWREGTYRIEVQRGITDIPQAVVRAGALLAGHALSFADPERSRFDGASLGDFAGTERRDAFPVPGAEVLLRPWISSVKGALA